MRGELTTGALVSLGSYVGRMYAPLSSLLNLQVDVSRASSSIERVVEVFEIRPEVEEAPVCRTMASCTGAISHAIILIFGVDMRVIGLFVGLLRVCYVYAMCLLLDCYWTDIIHYCTWMQYRMRFCKCFWTDIGLFPV